MTGRIRRNAVSSGSATTSNIPVRIAAAKPKVVDAWRELVQKRYNPETKYLNLDVSSRHLGRIDTACLGSVFVFFTISCTYVYYFIQSLIDDELVKKYNLTPPGHGGSGRDAAVIFKLASQLKPEVCPLCLYSHWLF